MMGESRSLISLWVVKRLVVFCLGAVLWACGPAASSQSLADDSTGGGSGEDGGVPTSAGGASGSSADAMTGPTKDDALGPSDAAVTSTDVAVSDAMNTDGSAATSDAGNPVPGVVVGTGSAAACVPLCVTVTTASSASAPDWGYEKSASCVLPNSLTGKNQACTVGQPIPPKPPQAGVVVLDNSTGIFSCTPLCVNATTASNPSASDWSYENNSSCVLPNSLTGKNQGCTTGQPIPPRPPQAGVVILDNTAGTSSCVPLCVYATTPSTPSASDWAYENNSPCVLPNSVTGKNQTCTTNQPVPPPAPRSGILLVLSGADATCVPLCAVATGPTDPTAPDWSYENNAACVLRNSLTAQGKRTCTAFGPPPSFVPPALTGTKVHNGFFIQNGRLTDAYGHPFVMRGVSNPHLWFDTGAQYLAYTALDPIASYGTNTIRVIWDTTTLAGLPPVAVPAPASLLAEDLFRIVQLKMVPMVELQGATGLADTASLQAMAAYYVRPEVKKVLSDFQDYLLINIANEWSGTTNYESAYAQAINLLRTNGITHTLVIDAPAFGEIVQSEATRNADIAAWFANATTLLATDPLHNLLFSVHMYDFYPTSNPATVSQVLNFAGVGTTIPLVVGEFGWMHDGIAVDYLDIMSMCQTRGIGYLGWSWFGNAVGTSVQDLNMVTSWGGPLASPWGTGITQNIKATAVKATIFP